MQHACMHAPPDIHSTPPHPHPPANSSPHSSSASQRYRYLCAFEVAAAAGEKLKAALRQIYEDSPVISASASAPLSPSRAVGGDQIK
jgi:hypothetical protein